MCNEESTMESKFSDIMETRMTDKKTDKSTWAIGGGLLIGLGVGFFFLQQSPLAFVGSMLAGLGLGLVITAFLSIKTG
jgi:hypothetical protein